MPEYIEREAAHRMMVGLTRYMWTSPVSAEQRVTVDADDVNFGLDKIPAADVAPVVHGRWVNNTRFKQKRRKCSECGLNSDFEFNFCPNCGAKMDGEETS